MKYKSILLLMGILIAGFLLGVAGALSIQYLYTQNNRRLDHASDTQGDVEPARILDIPTRELASNIPESVIQEDNWSSLIVVSVTGAVRKPQVYRFKEGERVVHAIEKAGGCLPEADLDDINIAAKLMDDSTLYIPYRLVSENKNGTLVMKRTPIATEVNPPRYTRSGWASSSPFPLSTIHPASIPSHHHPQNNSSNSGGLININRASLHELQTLPGIGPKTAEKIIDYRQEKPFARIEELQEVHGIGPKKFDAVKHLICVN